MHSLDLLKRLKDFKVYESLEMGSAFGTPHLPPHNNILDMGFPPQPITPILIVMTIVVNRETISTRS